MPSASTAQAHSATRPLSAFLASTAIPEAASIYLRYDGAISAGNDNHTLNIGVRIAWSDVYAQQVKVIFHIFYGPCTNAQKNICRTV
jgi:hypothetical protein